MARESLTERPDELYLPSNGTWEYPLSRSEKLQRLLNLFEADADHFAEENENLRNENEELRQENAILRAKLIATQAGIQRRRSSGADMLRRRRSSGASCSRRRRDSEAGPGDAADDTETLDRRLPPNSLTTPRACFRESEGTNACATLSGDSSPASSQCSSLSESLFPTPPETPQRQPPTGIRPEGGVSSGQPQNGRRPQLPGLGLDRLGAQLSTPCSATPPAEPAVSSTPRCFSIRTPPGTTPRVRSIVTPRSQQQLSLVRSSPHSGVAATPRSLSRVCSIVTPRSGCFQTPAAASTGQFRHALTLQQLCEDRVPSSRDQDNAQSSDAVPSQDVTGDAAVHRESGDHEESVQTPQPKYKSRDERLEEDCSDDASSSQGEEPEWMSFATPEGGGASLLPSFEELWSQDQSDSSSQAPSDQPSSISLPADLTPEAIWRLVEQRAKEEIKKALQEAEQSRSSRPIPLRRGQALPSRRPRRGERTQLVADLAKEGAAAASTKAQGSELLRPVAERLGTSVAKANSAMQDAARFAREASAAVGFGSSSEVTIRTLMPEPEVHATETDVKTAKTKVPATETDVKTAKTKVVDAANLMKEKLSQGKILFRGLRKPAVVNAPFVARTFPNPALGEVAI